VISKESALIRNAFKVTKDNNWLGKLLRWKSQQEYREAFVF
jgi:hypothetical protein